MINKDWKKWKESDGFKSSRIYATITKKGQGVHTLSRVSGGSANYRYAFVALSNTLFYMNGVGRVEDILKNTVKSHDVYVFETQQEFLEWALLNTADWRVEV
ncbi:MAG: hypothetical protein KAS32_02470 [Candidatus Peribacteraceae bacterium]|nr:hypothetical protein [Candidatus Peribacteraceae bacterium]